MPEIIGLIHLCEHLKSVGVNNSRFRFYEELTQRSHRTTEEHRSLSSVEFCVSSVELCVTKNNY